MSSTSLPDFSTIDFPSFGILVFGASNFPQSPPLSISSWKFSPSERLISQRGASGGLIPGIFRYFDYQESQPRVASPLVDPPAAVEFLIEILRKFPSLSFSSLYLLEILGFFRFSTFPTSVRYFPSRLGSMKICVFSSSSPLRQILSDENYRKFADVENLEIKNFPEKIENFDWLSSDSKNFDFYLIDFDNSQDSSNSIDNFLSKFSESNISKTCWLQRIFSIPIIQPIKLSTIAPMISLSINPQLYSSFSSSDPTSLISVDFSYLPWLEYFPNFIRPDSSSGNFNNSENFELGSNNLIQIEHFLAQIAFQLGKTSKYGA